MSYLPPSVQSISPRLAQAARDGNAGLWQRIIDSGYQQIAIDYVPDPVYRPHHYLLRWLAKREWGRTIRQTGVLMRQTSARRTVELWDTHWEQEIEDVRHARAEPRRRDSVGFDTDEQIRLARETEQARVEMEIRLMQARATIEGQNRPPTEDELTLIKRISAEIAAVQNDPSLSQEQVHQQVKVLRDALAYLLQKGSGAQRRG